MGIRGRGYEGCKVGPYHHTRGSIRCFSENDIFDMKLSKYKKPFQERSSGALAPPR